MLEETSLTMNQKKCSELPSYVTDKSVDDRWFHRQMDFCIETFVNKAWKAMTRIEIKRLESMPLSLYLEHHTIRARKRFLNASQVHGAC